MANPTDQIQYVFNPLTGKFDAVKTFNADRIVTAALNAAGSPRVTYDPPSSTFVEDGPAVVVDNAGNVVTR